VQDAASLQRVVQNASPALEGCLGSRYTSTTADLYAALGAKGTEAPATGNYASGCERKSIASNRAEERGAGQQRIRASEHRLLEPKTMQSLRRSFANGDFPCGAMIFGPIVDLLMVS